MIEFNKKRGNWKCKMKENRNFLNFQLILLKNLTLFINLVIIH